jgi:membrane-bound serine protease (ClpP class)
MMTGRLIVAIVTTIIEEAVLVAIVLWGLPALGIDLHIGVLIALMAALAAIAVTTYLMGSRVLKRKPVVGLPDMVGARGRAVSDLAPEGVVIIKGELWESRAEGRKINAGNKVIVVGQEGLKLIVKREKPLGRATS